jgi:hypothetical protein
MPRKKRVESPTRCVGRPTLQSLRACPEITHTVALGAESFSDERQHSSHHPGRIEEKDAFETYTAISFNFDSLILGQALIGGPASSGSTRGYVPEALRSLEHGLHVCRASQINYLLPILWTSLGYTYALAGRTREGIPLLERALTLNRSAKFTYGEAWASVYLGFASVLDHRYGGMLDYARSVLQLACKHKYRAIEVDALLLLGDVHRNPVAPAPVEAERYYLQACDLSLELGLRPEYTRCQKALVARFNHFERIW